MQCVQLKCSAAFYQDFKQFNDLLDPQNFSTVPV